MKNLKICSQQALNFSIQRGDTEALLLSAFDIERNRLFFASSQNFLYTLHLHAPREEGSLGATQDFKDAHYIDLEPGDSITSMDYIMEKEALIIGTSDGLLLLHVVDDNATELVGQVEGGVRWIAPSPDGDLLGVVTGLGRVLIMTHDWDVLYETAIEDTEDDHVNVANGSAERSLQSKLSWRGDGKFFATLNEVNGSGALKKLKVWERDSGALHAVSESKAFMGAILDWMPSGAKIAAVYDRKSEDKCPSIVFYERNGLERSSFSINELKDSTVGYLCWNCSSDLLALVVKHQSSDSVQIWYLSNNRWYLKQEITYPKHDGVKILWDPVKPLQLICWTGGGLVSVYNFIWVTAVTDSSMALVIDGSKILATPLLVSLMPPPMSLFNLTFPRAVQDVAFLSMNSRNFIAALLSTGSLSIAELPAIDSWEELEGKELNVDAASLETPVGSIQHLTWLDSHTLLCVIFNHTNSVAENNEDGRYYLLELEVSCSQDHVSTLGTLSGWHIRVRNRVPLNSMVIGMAANPVKRESAFIQLNGGTVFEYTSYLKNLGTLRKVDGLNFSVSCPWLSVVIGCENGLCTPVVAGLDGSGKLHVNGKVICNNCRNFSFYSNLNDQMMTHLILVTKQDLLFVVDMGDILRHGLDEKYENFVNNTSTRRRDENKKHIHIWERGANVIGVLHGDEAAVVLQTIRGNLECIFPRKLVLASIVNNLAHGRFKDALLMVRRQRIDFNVIVDFRGWRSFCNAAAEFVKQVSNLSHITDFICSIKNDDVTKILYKDYISTESFKEEMNDTDKGNSTVDKISSVLQAIRKALEEHVPESPARELCILTTLARSNPPDLEEALKRIKITRDLELSNSDDLVRKTRPSAEEALKHLLWLSDTNAVYEAALGLYDLNLAAIVALNSQHDPKEFLPYLEELQQMPEALMQYNIDLKLQRYEKALTHIVSAGDAHFSDSMNLMKKHPHLFPLGYQLITEPSKRLQVLEAWGDHYHIEKSFDDAALTYLSCSNLEKAFKAYRAGGNWSGVFTVAGLLNLQKKEIIRLGNELCEELQALGKPCEAAKVALDYCADVNCAVNLLISARSWEEAMRVAFQYRRDDLVTEVKSNATDCARSLIGEYEEGLEKVGKYLARYLAVRQRRLLLAAKLSNESSFNEPDDDTVSEASSTFSGMSAYTTGTTRTRTASVGSSKASKAKGQKRERNRGKIRAGSPDEELALVEHLKGMSLTAGAQLELKSLLVVLVMHANVETARKLQQIAENYQLSQMAAVKLSENTTSTDVIDVNSQTMEFYLRQIRNEQQSSDSLSWRLKVLI